MKARVRRRRDGSFVVDLPEHERGLLRSLLGQLRALLLAGEGGLQRLFPPAYADDPEREAEYRAMVHDDLLERHLASLDTVEATLDATSVDEVQLMTWMGAVNDLRLVLGTRLDVSEDMGMIDPDHPDAGVFAVYDYLTWLLDQIVDAVSGR